MKSYSLFLFLLLFATPVFAQQPAATTYATATVIRSSNNAASGRTFSVSGTLEWTDKNGNLHPIRFADVKVWDSNFGFDDELALIRTDETGFYSATITSEVGTEFDVYLQVFTHNGLLDVLPPGNRNEAGEMDLSHNVLTETFTVSSNVTINAQVPNTTVAGNAFSIFDGLLVAAQFTESFLGAPLPLLPVEFPSSAGVSQVAGPPDLHMQVIDVDKYDWDVLHHEYGHVVGRYHNVEKHPALTAAAGDTTKFRHGLGQHLSELYGKDKGTRLAWAEGWPSFFAIVLQQEMNVAAMGIPQAGDLRYDDIDGAAVILNYSLESVDGILTEGEDDEVAVQRILWDLYDDAADPGDDIALGFGPIWDAMRSADSKNLSGFWKAIADGKTLKRQTELGAIFAEWGVAPKQETPDDEQPLSLDGGGRVLVDGDGGTVTFRWKPNGGAGDAFKSDKFVIEFYNHDLTFKLHESPELSIPEYTLTEQEWLEFFFSSLTPNGYDFKWIVRGTNKRSPETGAYLSPAFSVDGGVDVSYVIDIHGTMGNSLGSVQNALLRMLESYPISGNNLYQVVAFNGDIFDNGYLWQSNLPTLAPGAAAGQIAALRTTGAAECDDKVVSGYAALSGRYIEMDQNGHIFFATNRTLTLPIGLTLPQVAINFLKSRGIRVNVLLSGPECPKRSKAGTMAESDALQAYAQMAYETGGTFAYLPDANSGDPQEAQRYENTAFNMARAGLAPVVTLIESDQAPAGAELTVTIYGADTHFDATTTLDFGPGLTVNDVAVLSPSQLQARITVAEGAASGFRDVNATTLLSDQSTEIATGIGAFEVADAPATPLLLGLTPRTGSAGDVMTVRIDAFGTAFDATTTLELGEGITVLNINPLSATQLEATLRIEPNAAGGFRTVTAQVGGETVTTRQQGTFLVLESASSVAITTVAPSKAAAGTTVDIVVVGANTTFAQGASTLGFSNDTIQPLSLTVLSATTLTARVDIPAATPPGLYDISVTTGTEVAVLPGGFEVTTATDVEQEGRGDLPADYALAQNYPNPFNPVTVIPFDVKDPTHVHLTVYDALGRAVRTLIDRPMNAGSYTVDFDAGDLPSGVYFYQLRAGSSLLNRKMILQK